MCRTNKMMELVTEIAHSSPNSKWKHAAVLCKGGRILSVGQNTELATYHSGHTRHAEEDVFRKTNLQQTPCILYLSRVLSSGSIGLSRPCENCLRFLLEGTRVKRVYFTMGEGLPHSSLDLNKLRNNGL